MLLAELWNGNIAPVRHLGENSEEIRHLRKLIESNCKKLENGLDEAQKSRWETYQLCVEEYLSLIAEDAFCCGAAVGARLLAEMLLRTEEK